MEGNAFISEVYRRINLKYGKSQAAPQWSEIHNDSFVTNSVKYYKRLLPLDRNASILDIGFGNGG